ncbi:vacuolar import and degradation protein-domain-containing protein [Astrocystis sublimbata]|nr:vacuolar import and degradation protein-domain-containing protein [Astrocystis sublimbata]
MPTPAGNTPPTPPELPSRTHSSSCPEDVRSPSGWSPEDGLEINTDSDATTSPDTITPSRAALVEAELTALLVAQSRSTTESPRSDSPSSTERSASEPLDMESPSQKPSEELGQLHGAAPAEPYARGDIGTPTTGHEHLNDDNDGRDPTCHDEYEPSMGFETSNSRVLPLSATSFLRPGSKFHGTQQSERQVYDVQVEIKYVDLRESFLCGYLKIQGLTEDNPTLTTYFEGEIIGNHYDFLTKHEGWGATEKIDLNHWGKFSAFRQYSKQVRKGIPVSIPNLGQRENIFMRWKEHFLVPDHRVTSINGASFEGFYYICFNQREGSVSGIYFHSKSEKFQQLELKHVEDRGCFSAMEFR